MAHARTVRSNLVAAARRHGWAHEAEDIAHDILLRALRRSVDVGGIAVHGAARRHAAFLARTAARRRDRERAYGRLRHDAEAPREDRGGTPIAELSPALRTTVHLLLAELTKAELRVVLGIGDAALRKRFQALRARAPLARPPMRTHVPSPPLRRAQLEVLPHLAKRTPSARVLGIRDPDGHGVFLAQAFTSKPAPATADASCSTDS